MLDEASAVPIFKDSGPTKTVTHIIWWLDEFNLRASTVNIKLVYHRPEEKRGEWGRKCPGAAWPSSNSKSRDGEPKSKGPRCCTRLPAVPIFKG